jgi:ubiquinone/menaquinone biosynthesis C-methylase UbiE
MPVAGESERLAAEEQWFWQHYSEAVDEIVGFCEPRGVPLAGTKVADVGSGDGIMAAGLFDRTAPACLVGFDIVPTNRQVLIERCRRYGVAVPPDRLEFRQSTETQLPAPDAAYDFVYSWSAFEHISQPPAVLAEIHRIVRPGGWFFLQLWPFYYSANGSHLWDWFPEPHHHLGQDPDAIVTEMRASGRHNSEWTEYMITEFQHLNRITINELQRDVVGAGFDVSAVELITAPMELRPELAVYAWTDLAIGGIKLLARPRT